MKDNTLRTEIFFNIRKGTDEFNDIDDIKLNRLMFLREGIRRLTTIGVSAMSTAYTPFHFKNPRHCVMAKDLLALSRHTCYPYYINNKEIILFDKKLSFLLELVDGDLDLWYTQIFPSK